MVVAAHVTPLDKPVGLFTQQLLRYQGLPDIAKTSCLIYFWKFNCYNGNLPTSRFRTKVQANQPLTPHFLQDCERWLLCWGKIRAERSLSTSFCHRQ